jgi:peptidoglycan/xylan/chitin deacetylase (PgdA/CDA1 family)
VARAVLNLTFHGIGDPPSHVDDGERQVWLTADMFRGVLDRVRDRGDVRLMFDDGNSSDATIALPALAERGLTATFFLVAGRVGKPGFVGADDVRALLDAGMEIGSHGMMHRPWRHLSAAQLNVELQEARSALEEYVGNRVTAAACPFGAYDRRVLRALRVIGFNRVFTSDGGRANPSAWLQPRNTVRPFRNAEALAGLLDGRPGAGSVARGTKGRIKAWR